MAKVSFRNTVSSKLDSVQKIEGQLIVVQDTGELYKDIDANNRIQLGGNVGYVDTLPLAPIKNKIYILNHSEIYVYDTEWHKLNANDEQTFTVAETLSNIFSGETLSTIFGKIAKWFQELKPVAFSGSYDDLTDKPLGFFTLSIDEDGNLYAYSDKDISSSFEYDEETGNLYYITEGE